MAIIQLGSVESTSYNKHNQTNYVYEVSFYLDDETNTKFKKRRVIGKKDPVTGETIPTGKRKKAGDDTPSFEQYKQMKAQSEKQYDFDRNAKKQMTRTLKESAEKLEEIISVARAEIEYIHRTIQMFGIEGD